MLFFISGPMLLLKTFVVLLKIFLVFGDLAGATFDHSLHKISKHHRELLILNSFIFICRIMSPHDSIHGNKVSYGLHILIFSKNVVPLFQVQVQVNWFWHGRRCNRQPRTGMRRCSNVCPPAGSGSGRSGRWGLNSCCNCRPAVPVKDWNRSWCCTQPPRG